MSWLDAAGLAARSVRRRLGRAVLTVVAVALATALLSALLLAAGSARARVLDEIADGGPLAGIRVVAASPDPFALDSDDPSTGEPRAIDEAARRRIETLDGVAAVVPVLAGPVLVVTEDPPVAAAATRPTEEDPTEPFVETLVGLDLARAGDLPVTVLAGRLPAATARRELAVTEGFLRRLGVAREDAAVVLGTEIVVGSPRFFPEPVGEDDGADRRGAVRGRWQRQTIVGVVAQEAGAGQLLAPLDVVRAARAWTLAGPSVDGFDVSDSPYSALFVVADGLEQVGPVRERITRVGYATSAPESLIESVQRYVRVVEIVLGGIGTIALVIAALGITNAMLAAVRERRREIGVLKAIGARDRDVRRVFLLEAGALGAAGGLLGTTGGWAIAQGLTAVINAYLRDQGLVGVALDVPALVIVGGVVGATLLAVVAGAVPAQRAARLPARQAMGDR